MKKCVRVLLAFALIFCVAFATVGCKSDATPPYDSGIVTGDGNDTLSPDESGDTTDPDGDREPSPIDPDEGKTDPTDPDDGEGKDPIDPDEGDKEEPDKGEDPKPEEPKDPVEEQPTDPTIEGFTLTAKDFTYVTPFFGTYAYVEKDDASFLLARDGTLTPCDNLRDCTIKQDKYTVYDDATGVCTLFSVTGETLFTGEYESIDYADDTVLAFTQTSCDTYRLSDVSQPIGTIESTDVQIVADGYLRKDGEESLYDLSGTKIARTYNGVRGYRVIDVQPQIGVMIVYKNQKYMYADETELLIDMQFDEAYPFVDGTAIAWDGMDWYTVYLSGNCQLLSSDELYFVDRHKNFVLFTDYADCYCYMDILHPEDGVQALGYAPKDARIYNGYIVDEQEKALFSLSENAVVLQGFDEITVGENGMIVRNGEDVRLMSFAQQTLCDYAEEIVDLGADGLFVKVDGKYVFFRISGSL